MSFSEYMWIRCYHSFYHAYVTIVASIRNFDHTPLSLVTGIVIFCYTVNDQMLLSKKCRCLSEVLPLEYSAYRTFLQISCWYRSSSNLFFQVWCGCAGYRVCSLSSQSCSRLWKYFRLDLFFFFSINRSYPGVLNIVQYNFYFYPAPSLLE